MMNQNNIQQIKDTIFGIVSRGLTITSNPQVPDMQYNTWQNYAQSMLYSCSYQYNPTIYINYLQVCTNALSLTDNNARMRMCFNYLLGVAKIL